MLKERRNEMKKYKVKGTVLDPDWGDDGFEVEVYAENQWDAINEATDIMNKEIGKGNIDDVYAINLRPEFVFLESTRDCFTPSQKTLTVGQLRKILEDYDEDSPVNIVDSNGMTKVFGYLTEFLVKSESEIEDSYY